MKIDFRTKFFLTLIIGISTMEGSLARRYYYLGIFLALLPYLFALYDRKISLVSKGIFYTGLAFLGQNIMEKFPNSFWAMILNLYAGIVIKILPGLIMGYYTMTTTKMSDLVYSLQKIKLPNTIIIPISVMFRFFYSIKQDYKIIGEAMYMHDLTLKSFFKNPSRFIEYKFVPLLMITSQTADNVAISAMTRGMKVDGERSSISSAQLRSIDYIFLAFGIFIISLFIRIKLC